MKAIVYNSNTGFTAEYAKLLSKATGIRAYSWKEAKSQLPKDTPVLFLGWVMANKLPEIQNVTRRFYIRAIGAVGLNQNEYVEQSIRSENGVPASIPVFLLPGGLDKSKLGLYHRLLLKIVELNVKQRIRKAVRPSEETALFLQQLTGGCNLVDAAHLESLIDWARNWKEPKKK